MLKVKNVYKYTIMKHPYAYMNIVYDEINLSTYNI